MVEGVQSIPANWTKNMLRDKDAKLVTSFGLISVALILAFVVLAGASDDCDILELTAWGVTTRENINDDDGAVWQIGPSGNKFYLGTAGYCHAGEDFKYTDTFLDECKYPAEVCSICSYFVLGVGCVAFFAVMMQLRGRHVWKPVGLLATNICMCVDFFSMGFFNYGCLEHADASGGAITGWCLGALLGISAFLQTVHKPKRSGNSLAGSMINF